MTTGKRLTIYIDENDMRGDVPLYEAIVRRLVALEAAGATVQTGIMGFGKHGRLHRKRLFGISDDRPVTITVVDSAEKVEFLAQELRSFVTEGVMVVEDVTVIRPDRP
jgi:PII-like signaling protein